MTNEVVAVSGDLLRARRRRRGLTQRELARELGTTPWVVSRLEAGAQESLVLAAVRPGAAAGVEAHETAAARAARSLVLVSLGVLFTVRFFTTKVDVLPGAANFVDVLLLPVLVLAALLFGRERARERRPATWPMLAALFLVVCVGSTLLNAQRVSPAPVLVFVYGFLGPLAFAWAAYRLWPAGNARAVSRFLVALGAVQFLVILAIDLPLFARSGNPDDIAGTFTGNAYQLVFFLLVFASLVAGIATFEPERLAGRLAPLVFLAVFVIVFLAQYRALLVSTAATVVFVAVILGLRRTKGFVIGALALTAFLAGFAYVADRYPALKFSPTVDAVREDPTGFVGARLEPGRDVIALYGDQPSAVLLGVGPGTFSSRAWRMFADVGDPANAEGAEQPYAAALTGGVAYATDVSERYMAPRLKTAQAVLGSNAVNSPFSSYLALLAEVGVLGFAVMVGLYAAGLARSTRVAWRSIGVAERGDPLPAVAVATAVSFFLLVQMGLLENWWEVARATVPSWILLAVCTKEARARGLLRR